MVFPSWLRPCAAMILLAGFLGLGCKSSSTGTAGTVTLGGTVTYTRLPLVHDSDGKPTGLSSTGVVTPSRGVMVRAFQLTYDVDASGVRHQNWRLSASALTDSNGDYSFRVYSGYPTFLEVDSVWQQYSGHLSTVRIIADPAGINSALSEPYRPIYAYRKDVAGNLVPSPVVGDNTSTSTVVAAIGSDTTLDVALGSSDQWVATRSDWYVPGTNTSSTQSQLPPSAVGITLGSKLLGILDDAYIVSYYYGDPTPSQVKGGFLDLHYYPGRSEATRRSFMVYDRSLTPLSYDGTIAHYFGSLSGSTALDDAWDQGVTYPMLARNFLYGQGKTALFATGLTNLASLSPDLAVVDGMGDAIAATLLQTPYLTDASAATAFSPRDIRTIPTTNPGIASAADLAAVAWEASLKVYGVASPGTYAEWKSRILEPGYMARLYGLVDVTQTVDDVTYDLDICSIYSQLGRLMEAKASSETVDLHLYFTNLSLFAMLDPYGIVWPTTSATWPYLATDWGRNPDSQTTALPSFTLSMSQAERVANPLTGATTYPNCTQGEVAFGRLLLNYDRSFRLSVSATSAGTVDPGTTIEVVVDGDSDNPYLFVPGAGTTYTLALTGNPKDSTNPTRHFLRTRVLNPTVKQDDLTVTVTLDKVSGL